MRQLTYLAPGKLEWWDVDEPSLGDDGAALVRPIAVATCDLDALIVRGTSPFTGPFPFGHECVAEVVDVGDGVASARPGDLVSVAFQVSCGECDRCRAGHDRHCERTSDLANYGFGPQANEYGGFLSDLVRVPFANHMLVRLPEGVGAEQAASASDNIPDAWRAVGPPLEAAEGAPVLVVGGAGSIDLYAAGIAVALGSEVDYASPDAWRLEIAERLGARPVEGAFPERLGLYPVTVDASGDPEGLACALRSTGPEGTCTSIGIYTDPLTPVPLFEMYLKGIEFRTGIAHARPAIPTVLDLIASGRLPAEVVTRRVVSWEEAADALVDHEGKLVMSRLESA